MTQSKQKSVWMFVLLALALYWSAPALIGYMTGCEDMLASNALLAGDAAGGGAPSAATSSMLRIVLVDSGVWSWFLIILSIVGVAVGFTVFVEQRPEKLLPPGIEDDLLAMFDEENYEEALSFCEAEDNVITRIAAAGLARIDKGYDSIQDAIGEAADQESTVLLQKLSYVGMIAAVAPMMGLLGTVVGMIAAFKMIATTAGSASPAQLASGIFTALITTAEGLIIAIPMLTVFTFLKNRTIRVLLDINQIIGDLFERFRK
ncbi:MAG: MotA/TolQ/ExbB proton channel family protein [Planctomycetota bacterium]